MVNFFNVDCMEFMKSKPDKFYDLAIVDPPYGIMQIGMKITKPSRPNSYSYKQKHQPKQWDSRPDKKYFNELLRISKNQIVWGGNYFTDMLPVSRCWIFWDKINGDGSHFADGEFAWTSFTTSSKRFVCSSFSQLNGGKDRIHPTEKPKKLYRWVLQTFTTKGQNIIDTHGGSMSSAIACDMEGYDLDICEIDKDYFDAGVKRFNIYKSQGKLF